MLSYPSSAGFVPRYPLQTQTNTARQRAIFWIQTPLGFLGGLTVYLSIPPSTAHQTPKDQEKTTTQKLLEVDYLGAITLVSPTSPKTNPLPY